MIPKFKSDYFIASESLECQQNIYLAEWNSNPPSASNLLRFSESAIPETNGILIVQIILHQIRQNVLNCKLKYKREMR